MVSEVWTGSSFPSSLHTEKAQTILRSRLHRAPTHQTEAGEAGGLQEGGRARPGGSRSSPPFPSSAFTAFLSGRRSQAPSSPSLPGGGTSEPGSALRAQGPGRAFSAGAVVSRGNNRPRLSRCFHCRVLPLPPLAPGVPEEHRGEPLRRLRRGLPTGKVTVCRTWE